MITIPNTNNDPARNLAMEEYILTGMGMREPVLFFYVNAPSIIIGRHQNTLDEIDQDFIHSHKIRVVRRCSGGGAVYHDLGNLNYSLIRPGDTRASSDFSVLLQPILDALHELGLPAEKSGRNDLTLNGAKFSGNAYYHNRSGSVLHGTLLFDSDLSVLAKALKPRPEKLQSKGVRSVRSRVCCIKEALPQIGSTDELKAAIIRHFSAENDMSARSFSDIDNEKIEMIADERYRNDSWTYGESPAFNVRCLIHQPGGWIDFRADVRDGSIISARFFGDFFCTEDISELENALKGISWDKESLSKALTSAGWENCFPQMPIEEFIREIRNKNEK